MTRILMCLLFVGLGACALSCKSATYDTQQDRTVLTVRKYGSVAIPKRWKEVYHDKEIGAHSFLDATANQLTINFFPPAATGLYQEGSTDREFLAAYVVSLVGTFRASELRIDTLQDKQASEGYTLLRVYSVKNIKDNATVLFGIKRGLLYDFRFTATTWSQPEVDAFLVRLFGDN